MSYRVKEMDYDTRRKPKTDRSCVRCQKDIKPDSPVRYVHLVDGGNFILHPEDEAIYAQASRSDDLGAWLIGMDCARLEGLEWTHPA